MLACMVSILNKQDIHILCMEGTTDGVVYLLL